MRGRLSILRPLVAVLLVSLMVAPAGAYTVLKTYTGASKYWPGSNASWTVSTSGMPGVDNESFQQAIGAAFDSWQEVGCSELTFTSQGFSGSDPGVGIHFSVTTNSWEPDPSVADALAYTMTDNKK
ncbi:MAG: hypothetical protein VX938_08330, partial [Myxococcota bacterium]|nr:hypothetical protein [Myxococcota bacterium]